jgi:anti-sigma factor RsiW
MIESREEELISHVIDGDASPTQWRELESIASGDPLVWKRLAEAQRDSALLGAALGRAAALADAVELPKFRLQTDTSAPITQLRWNRLGAWTGWAVAALVTIVAFSRFVQPQPHMPGDATDAAQTAGFASAAQAFQAYLDRGRESGEVVGEVPGKVLVETKPIETGTGYEVIYLRQVIERAIVPDLYQMAAQDEAGRPTLVRYQPPVRSSM